MAPATPAEGHPDGHVQVTVAEDEHAVEAKAFDPATYAGPVLPAGGNAVSWGGRANYQDPRPDGNRYAQSQWQFTMSGALGHEVPHLAYVALNGDQQRVFDRAGQLPWHLLGRPSAGNATGGASASRSGPALQAAIEAPPGPSQPPSCSQCSSRCSSIKKIRTHGGLMRSLCNNCVYDMAGGNQEEFARKWADGCPL